MEPVKPLEQFFEPDPRMSAFVVRPIGSSDWRAATVSDHYGDLEGLDLNPGVPESVVSYVNVIKNLYLYGWLCYPFFTVCHTHTAMAVEMALRLRIPEPVPQRDRRTLRPLLEQAVSKGLIQDSGFPSLPAKQAEAQRFHAELAQMGVQRTIRNTSFTKELVDSLPKLRNEFAHPHDAWVVTPCMALEPIRVAVEIINQLWQ
jgi:hypothetical protein